MKLSAFLAVSLPLIAMSQAPATAATDAMADQGNWLKASIATLKPVDKSTPLARKVSHALPVDCAPPVKLRPFVPNRYLPRERDLRQALTAQQPQVDNSGAPLAGAVTTNYAAPRMVSAYDGYSGSMMSQAPQVVTSPGSAGAPRFASTKKAAGSRSPRVMPGQAPMLPEQLTQPANVVAPLIPEPPQQRQMARAQFPISMPVAAFP